MIVDKKVVAEIAELAMLSISDSQTQDYVDSLSKVLNLVEQMQSVDTTGIEPMSNPLDGVQTLRADEANAVIDREKYQKIAPETADGLYLVPKVID